jgi:hypothetical protein
MGRRLKNSGGEARSGARVRNFLLYALGEVILVSVGILIALEVDNWNEERLEQRRLAEYAQSLVSDLQRDIAMLQPIVLQMQRTLDMIDALGAYTRGRSLDQIDNLDLYYLLGFAGYRPYEWHRAAIEQLQASGALSNMKNADLVMKITAYDALTHHLDDDYAMDHEIWFEAKKMANQIVDSNYPLDEKVMEVMVELYRQPFTFPEARFREVYANTELELLTDDVSKLRALVNQLGDLGNIKAHTDREIPNLLTQANELIGLLGKEYPETIR